MRSRKRSMGYCSFRWSKEDRDRIRKHQPEGIGAAQNKDVSFVCPKAQVSEEFIEGDIRKNLLN